MKQTETASFLAVIKTAYPFFEITIPVTKLWHSMLQDMDYEIAKERLGRHIRTSRFAPTIADICNPEGAQPSFYELQRPEEQQAVLSLQEYMEEAVPMPDYIRGKFERHQASRSVNPDES